MTSPTPLPDLSAAPSFDAAADQLFSFANSQESGDTGGDEQPTQEAESTQPAQSAEPEPAQETQPAEQPGEEEIDDDLNPDRVEEKQHFYSLKKSARLQEAFKTVKALESEIPGFNLDMLRGINQTAATADRMTADFDSADPALVGNVVDFFTRPPENATPEAMAQHARSVEIMADGLIERLPQINPVAAERIGKSMVQQYVNSLYENAVLNNKPEMFTLAQHMDNQLRGKFMTPEQFQRKSPEQLENERLRAQLNKYEQQGQTTAQQQMRAFNQETTTKISEAIDQEIAASISEPIRKAYEAKPDVWERIVRDLRQEIERAVEKNPAWKQRFEFTQRQVRQTRREGDREQLLAMVRTFAAQVAKGSRKGILDFYAKNTLNANTAAHQEQQQAAARRDGTVSSAPPIKRGNTGDMSDVVNANSEDEAWDALFKKANLASQGA